LAHPVVLAGYALLNEHFSQVETPQVKLHSLEAVHVV